MSAKIAVLVSYFEKQINIIDKLLSKLTQNMSLENLQEENTIFRAYCIHNIYSAFEQLFEQVAKTFENNIDDMSKYHIQLLQRMNQEVDKIRPQLLSDQSTGILNEMRKFRHIFIDKYEYDLDGNRILKFCQLLLDNWAIIKSDLSDFQNFLLSQL